MKKREGKGAREQGSKGGREAPSDSGSQDFPVMCNGKRKHKAPQPAPESDSESADS